jgi:alkylation response protein AidB-like acyl-CoA dehydrogenase
VSNVAHPPAGALLDVAREMIPALRDKALRAEHERSVPAETHRAFQEAGFYRVLQPSRWGGYEMPFGLLAGIAGELGRGCGSSAWVFSNLNVQSWIIGMHRAEAQEEVWGENPDALCASSFPVASKGRYVDGGIVLDGQWSFASGVDFVDWENCQVFVPNEGGPPDHRFCLVPKADFTVKDDWFVSGLSGTGSKSIVLHEVFVPAHRMLDTKLIGGGVSPGSTVNPGPLYKIPPFSIGSQAFSGVILGLARGALDLIVGEMAARRSVGGVSMAEMPTVQVRVAEAAAEVAAAEAVLIKDADEAMRIAETGERPPIEVRARWRLTNAYAAQLCLRAIERLHPLAGARGLGQDNLFLLAWRDVHAAVSQITMAWDIQTVNAGRVMFGLPPQDPRL